MSPICHYLGYHVEIHIASEGQLSSTLLRRTARTYSASVTDVFDHDFLFAFPDSLLFCEIQFHCAFLILLFGESLVTQLSLSSLTSLEALKI
jgi:hypothetical protein